jgi:hypothetical protein
LCPPESAGSSREAALIDGSNEAAQLIQGYTVQHLGPPIYL